MTIAIPEQIACRAHVLEELDLRLPFWRYHAALGTQPYSCLLDSATDPQKLGKYSFICGDPFVVYRAKRQPGKPYVASVEITARNGAAGLPLHTSGVSRYVANPFEDLRRLFASYKVEYDEYRGHPAPFLSGAVGYFGYEAGYFVEALPDRGADDLNLPDIYLMFVDSVIGHCHQSGKSYLSVVGRGVDKNAAHREAFRMRDEWRRRIEQYEGNPEPLGAGLGRGDQCSPAIEAIEGIELQAHFDEESYARAVRTVKEHILAGDAYEVCLTHRLESPFKGDAWKLYQELRRINPAPFAAFLKLPEVQVISSSPERFLHLSPDRIAESRPIKGTRPRGQTPEQDDKLLFELFNSAKDRAENVMIVDLVRNDLGRVSKFGSVHVPELMTIEKYATVFQMVSTVRGELQDGADSLDLIKACFPGGSMTGAPKIAAMNIIDRLEPVKRGIYSGSIGYLDFSGALDLNIVIRTMIVKDGRCYLNVGGAIVADSDPVAEYAETMDKARALIMALNNYEKGRPQEGTKPTK